VAQAERRPRRVRRVLLWVTGALVLALAGGAAAAYRTGWIDDWFGDDEPTSPLAAPVPGFTPPSTAVPPVVARTAASPRPARACVRRALGPALRDPHLADLRAVVAPLTGQPVLDVGHGTSMPASTLKLLTATTALDVLGPDQTFATRVVAGGRRGIVLVGGGDPFLQATQPTRGPSRHDASLQTLAALTARQLQARGTDKVRLSYDTSLFTGPRVDPHWPKTYVPEDVVSPITALWADEGLDPDGYGRVTDPPATAAALFATFLRKRGIEVSPTVTEHQARPHARELARVTGVPVADIVERVLQYSDNEGAEVLAHQAGLELEGDASYAGGVRAVTSTLGRLGIDLSHATIQDGSGLSRDDRLDAETLVEVLQLAASPDRPDLRSVVTGLPVAAYAGSLAYRFDDSRGRGIVRAKTGTLTGTSGLAGLTTDARNHTLVFAFVSNHVNPPETLDTRAALDRLTTALAVSRC
jgi:D-alanyl-D-alanine carboxypeptidase/D-alanyl-D-alanine-endopeptidase (penicillin-binding protein 4)